MLMLRMAFRNIWLHKLKTSIIGGVIVFGTVLAVLGNSFVDAISGGMKKSLVHSITGDLQIYSKDAKDKLSVFGSPDGNTSDIGHLPSFAKVRETLLREVPEIRAIVPMGINIAMLTPGNILDTKLEELRRLYREGVRDGTKIGALRNHIRRICLDVGHAFLEASKEGFAANGTGIDFSSAPRDIARVESEKFWSEFETHPEESIEFLGNHLAPLAFDDSMIYFAYVGTVPEKYSSAFDGMEIVRGQSIPKGKRGFLFNDYTYETMVKHRIARKLDSIKKEIEKQHRTIAGSQNLKDGIASNVAQAAEIYTQLAPEKAEILVPKLQKELGSSSGDIRELVRIFLDMKDENFLKRYSFFYQEIAPHLMLYKVGIGDILPLTAYTKGGVSRSVNLKVYGTFRFKSFDSSPIAGSFSIMDLISFRDLYGFQTAAMQEETRALEREMGLSDIGRENVDALFGQKNEEVRQQPVGRSGSALHLPDLGGRGDFAAKRKVFEQIYSEADMEDGTFLNAAVLLKDPSRLNEALVAIRAASERGQLGIQVVSWQESAGIVGQLTVLVRALLLGSVFIIFVVAALIIMNAMLMATLERAREIGTMRAIGAQRSFLARLFVLESALMSVIFGTIGAAIAVCIVFLVNRSGIPAFNEIATFFFSGPRLFLGLNPLHLFLVIGAMTLISILSTQYPAWRAMRISPLEAMQKSE